MMNMQKIASLLLCWLSLCVASIFDYEVVDTRGNLVPLSKYKHSKAIIIVNIATDCQTSYANLRGLVELYDEYKDKGLEILAFPCDQYGHPVPRSNLEIEAEVMKYGVSFPVFGKVNIIGEDAHPLFKYIKASTSQTDISWNYCKVLLVDGVPMVRYSPKSLPKRIEPDLRHYLGIQSEL